MAEKINGLSQACIISARTMSEAVAEATELAAAEVCTGSGKRPCGICRSCRKVQHGSHPDVIRIGLPLDDKGKPKKEIVVDQIRQMISDAYILPNEADRKIYIIENADLMNIAAQNAALKLLEEPPAGAAILLCAVNVPELLPTVRSRCRLIICAGDSESEDPESLRLSLEYIKLAANSTPSKLCSFCFANEGMSTAAANAFCGCTMDVIADILAGRRESPGLSQKKLLHLYALMGKCRSYLSVNTGVKHVFGLLAVESEVSDKEGTIQN